MPNPKPIFALANWTIDQRHDGWYYGDTYRDDPK